MTDTMQALRREAPRTYAADETLTMADVADALGKDLSTIKRWKDAGRWPNAVKDTGGRGTWRIPVSDLVASGDIEAAQVASLAAQVAGRRESKQVAELRERVIRLEEQLSSMTQLAAERKSMIDILVATKPQVQR
ncbi:hypothetical protein [Pedococcus sp. P5_B7]